MRRALGYLPLLHGLALLVYLALRSWVSTAVPPLVPERGWWALYDLISLLNEFTPFFFLPLPLWLFTAILARTRGAVLAAALPWLLFGWLYGEMFLPRQAHTARVLAAGPAGKLPAPPLRVMTFNVFEAQRTTLQLAESIRQANADVVLVQELNTTFAQELDTALAGAYPHRRLRPAGGSRGGGIWSRHPFVSEEVWDGSRRGARWQHAVLSVDSRALHVVNLHLTAPTVRWRRRADWPLPVVTGSVTEGRSDEVSGLVPRLRPLAQGPEPLVVAGDLNMTDQTPEYRRLLGAGLADAHRRAGWGFGHTFPAVPVVRIFRERFRVPVPLIRIDHVLYSSRLAAQRVDVWPAAAGSDHLPVVAELVLRNGI